MRSNQINISNLLQRIRVNNDESAFEQLFHLYYARLLHFSHIILKNNELAEDVVLEVFTNIWEKRSMINEINRFNNYLYTSVKNKSLDKIKKYKELITYDPNLLPIVEQIHHLHPEKQLLNDELMKMIDAAILNLPDRSKLVYRLIKEDGMKYKEVAELLEISIKTVDNHLSLAMNRIRLEISAYINGQNSYSDSVLKLVK